MSRKFDGDENAIVDFKYSSDRARITWWFDHHQSAFLTPDDAAHFSQRRQRPNTQFYDPDFQEPAPSFLATRGVRPVRLRPRAGR